MLIRTIFLTCAGKLTDKQDKRLDAYIYYYLDTHNVSDININEMCEELKESGAMLRHIWSVRSAAGAANNTRQEL